MNQRSLLVLLSLLLLASTATLPVFAADEAAKPKSAKPEETELANAMSTLNGAWRKLRRQAADPASNASSLELVATIKVAATKSATLAPDLARDQPEANRAAFIAAYQKQMKEFLAALAKLEAAFTAGDNAAAGELIKNLGDLQRKGHKEYRRPESK